MPTIQSLIGAAEGLVKTATVILMGVALLVFMWGLSRMLFKGDDKAIKEGRNLMIWGVIALFVMVSVWAIVGFFQEEVGIPRTVETSPRSSGSTQQNLSGGHPSDGPGSGPAITYALPAQPFSPGLGGE